MNKRYIAIAPENVVITRSEYTAVCKLCGIELVIDESLLDLRKRIVRIRDAHLALDCPERVSV